MNFLVINDDPALLNVIQQVQTEISLSVTYTGSSSEGIALANKTQPDIILVSYSLDEMTGIEVCAIIRQFSTAPLFIISARDDSQTLIAALEAGADDYLVKPISARVLAAKILSSSRRIAPFPQFASHYSI